MDADPPAETRLADPPPDYPSEDTPPTPGASGGVAVRMPNRFRPEPIPPPARWYGWQTLLADGAAIALLGSYTVLSATTTISSDTRLFGLLAPGALAWGLGTPVLHARHRAFDRAAASGLARMIGLPLLMLGTVVASGPKIDTSWPGDTIANPTHEDLRPGYVTPLVVGGMAAAGIVALDAVFAWTSPHDVTVGSR